MANNRIYLVDPKTNEYIFFPKTMADGWYGVDYELLSEFLNSRWDEHPPIIVAEHGMPELYEKHITNGKKFTI